MRMPVSRAVIAAVLAVAVSAAAACGSSTNPDRSGAGANAAENNPVGDIPDNTVFVAFRPPSQQYEIKVPEGWARSGAGDAFTFTFTDKLNTVRVETVPAP